MTSHYRPADIGPLSAEHVSTAYHDHAVLTDVSLTITPGERTVLMGPNGSGKTTLLQTLAGSRQPNTGQVSYNATVMNWTSQALRAHRQRVQLVVQDPDDQLFNANVVSDISYGPVNLGLDEAEVTRRVSNAIDLLSIGHLSERPVHQLSHGEKKRVAIAGAVAMQPAFLLLDEPTAGLDPAGVREVIEALERVEAHHTTVVLSTHDVDFALAWGARGVVLVDGEVHAGPIWDILADQALITRARLVQPWAVRLSEHLPGGREAQPKSLEDILTLMDPRG